MIQTEKEGLIHLLKIAAPYLLFSTLYTTSILFLEETLGDHIYKVSGQIGSVFGLAVAFFLGFRMNSAYDRWWEARKIFGELTNNTRSFVAKVYVYCKNEKNIREPIRPTSTQLALDLLTLSRFYVKQLKREMHTMPTRIDNEREMDLLTLYGIDQEAKLSNEVLLAMAGIIEMNFAERSNIEKSDLMQHITRFYDIQGKAERIKNTPFLKIYSIFTRLMVSFYVVLIPLFIGDIDLGGEESRWEILSVPIMAIISTAFLTINKLANLFGEPFAENKTAVPIDHICATIEKNCLEVQRKIEQTY